MRVPPIRPPYQGDSRAGPVPPSRGWPLATSRPAEVLAGALLLALAGCGSGETEPHRLPPGLDLPVLGTVGRAPGGEATIVVDVDAAGRIFVEGRGPLGLTSLARELERRTADPRWREPDRSSRKILLLNADASLPWVVPCWVMQAAAGPTVAIYRIFLGARASDAGPAGAIGWTLRKDGWGWGSGRSSSTSRASPPPARRRSRAPRRRCCPPCASVAGDTPTEWVVADRRGRRAPTGFAVPTGYVARVVDLLLRAGVRQIRFEGSGLPSPSATDPGRRFDPDDVDALLACVARLKATPGGARDPGRRRDPRGPPARRSRPGREGPPRDPLRRGGRGGGAGSGPPEATNPHGSDPRRGDHRGGGTSPP